MQASAPKGLALSLASVFMKPVLCILLATALLVDWSTLLFQIDLT
jgi:hypothetical protein